MQMTMIIGALFAAICLGVAVNGFASLGDITDATQMADARGFAWFWTFLGSVGVLLVVVGWWAARSYRDEEASTMSEDTR